VVDGGSKKLSTGLAKIVNASKNMRRTTQEAKHLNAFKALFITDPDRASLDAAELSRVSTVDGSQKLVQEILSKKLTTADRITEIFSTHPNIIKRLRALQELE